MEEKFDEALSVRLPKWLMECLDEEAHKECRPRSNMLYMILADRYQKKPKSSQR